jgi:hypothetical protein
MLVGARHHRTQFETRHPSDDSEQVSKTIRNSAFIYSKQNIILIVSDSNPEEAEAGK